MFNHQKSRASFLTVLAAVTAVWPAPPADATDTAAERFTHIAGINLADLPSFDELALRFGPALVTHSGDAGDFEARACYQTLDKRVVLEFFHGEVDWGFALRSPMRNDAQCHASAALKAGSMSISGVELGMEKSAYERVVGKPQKSTVNHIENVFEYVRTLTDKELSEMVKRDQKNGYPQSDPEELRRWDVGITLNASFTNGRLTSFRVDRVETN
jgi:hypothetical protein